MTQNKHQIQAMRDRELTEHLNLNDELCSLSETCHDMGLSIKVQKDKIRELIESYTVSPISRLNDNDYDRGQNDAFEKFAEELTELLGTE